MGIILKTFFRSTNLNTTPKPYPLNPEPKIVDSKAPPLPTTATTPPTKRETQLEQEEEIRGDWELKIKGFLFMRMIFTKLIPTTGECILFALTTV